MDGQTRPESANKTITVILVHLHVCDQCAFEQTTEMPKHAIECARIRVSGAMAMRFGSRGLPSDMV